MSVEQKMVNVAKEIASGLLPIDMILETQGVTRAEFVAMSQHPRFTKLLVAAQAEWAKAENTRQRVELKSAHLVELALPEMYARLHDNALPLAARVELLKTMGKFARVGDNTSQGGGAGETFKITINMGAQKVDIEKALPPKVIEAQTIDVSDA